MEGRNHSLLDLLFGRPLSSDEERSERVGPLPGSDPVLESVAEKALRFAFTLTKDIHAVHVQAGEDNPEGLRQVWQQFVLEPAQQAGLAPPQLVVLDSPYRFVISPILDYVLELERQHPQRQIAVFVPELVERRWYHYALHNQRSNLLKVLLYLKGNKRIVMINVPWYLGDDSV